LLAAHSTRLAAALLTQTKAQDEEEEEEEEDGLSEKSLAFKGNVCQVSALTVFCAFAAIVSFCVCVFEEKSCERFEQERVSEREREREREGEGALTLVWWCERTSIWEWSTVRRKSS
jgi:hypothetical protein